MANYSTLEHSKTLGKTRISIFSTLASTLENRPKFEPEGVWTSAVHRQHSGLRQRPSSKRCSAHFEGAEGCSSTLNGKWHYIFSEIQTPFLP